MTNEELVRAALEKVGGKSNVLTATNCMTRLRVRVKDDAKIDDEGLKAIEGVMGIVHDRTGYVEIVVGPGKCRKCADICRDILAEYPEIKKAKVTEGNGGQGGASTVDIEIYGYDFETTDRVAKDLQARMIEAGGCSQVLLSRDEYTPEYQVDFDRTKLAVNGLNSTTAASYVNAAINGSTQSFYREDGEEYDIRVRYNLENRTSIEDIENIIVYNNAGKGIKVKDLGKVVESKVPPKIERKNRQRVITVSGVVADGYALSEVVETAQKIIAEADIPSELTVNIAGSFEDQQEMFGDLMMLLALIVILVYIVMASQFESFMSPFVIMFSIPFAIVGVILGLAVTKTPLGVMAMIGILILMGLSLIHI